MAVREGEMSAEHQMILDNILEYIEDQGKIVTYKWLSRELKIHVNLAKQLLYCFLIKYRKEKNCGLTASFVLSGVSKEKNEQKVIILNEEDLEKVKSSFSVINGNHVYSIQKTPLKDSNTIYITELENYEEGHQFSGIKPEKKIKDNIEIITPRSTQPKPIPKPSEPKKEAEPVKDVQPKKIGSAASKNGTKPNVLATMFKNQESKPKKIQNEEKSQTDNVKTTETKKCDSQKVEKSKVIEEKPLEIKKTSSAKSRKNLSLKKPPTHTPSVTVGKRRRIIEESSSSEDSDQESEEDPIPANQETPMEVDKEEEAEDEDPVTSFQPEEKYKDENEISKSEPRMIQQYQRKDEMFIDEDGYMITRKVMKLVQEPELTNKITEVNTSPPSEKLKQSEPIINSKGKKSAKNTANQPTLMNFFKRA